MNTLTEYDEQVELWSNVFYDQHPADFFDLAFEYLHSTRLVNAVAAERAYIIQYGRRPTWGRNLENFSVSTSGTFTFSKRKRK